MNAMYRTIKPLAAALVLLTAGNAARAQSTCLDYHKFNCPRSSDKRFGVNGQTKSAAVQVGKPTELNIIVYRGQDYRITLCPDAKILGEALAIRLLEKVREPREVQEVVITKEPLLDGEGNPTGEMREVRTRHTRRVFEEVDKVLWDNTEHDMAQEVEFTCTATKRIAVEVTAPGGTGKGKRSERQFDIGCVGILIEHMASPPMGFEPVLK